MKTLSVQVIGFTAGSPTTYTTQVHLDGETWAVPIRYSTFRDFYIKIDALEPDFNFDFPKKGGFFSSPPPAQRQVQLDAFMKKSVAHFCERQFPQNVLDLLDDLLEISAHVVKRQETVEPDTEDSASEQEEDDGDTKPKNVAAPTAVLASVPEVAVETVEIAATLAAEVVVEEVVVPAVAPVEEAKSASVEEVKPVAVEELKPVEIAEVVVPVEESVVEQVKPVKVAVTTEVEVTAVTPEPAVEVAAAPVVVDTPAAEEAEPIAAEVAPVAETVIVEAPVEVEAEPVVELEPVTEPVVVEAPVEVAPTAVEPVAVAAAFEKIVESVKLTLETPSLPEAAPLSSTSTSTEPPSPTAAEKKKKAKQLSEMQKRMRNQKRKEKRKKKSNMKVSAGKSHHAANGIEFDSDDDVLVRVQLPQRKQ